MITLQDMRTFTKLMTYIARNSERTAVLNSPIFSIRLMYVGFLLANLNVTWLVGLGYGRLHKPVTDWLETLPTVYTD